MSINRNLKFFTSIGSPGKLILVFLCLTVALAACNGDLQSDELEMTEKFTSYETDFVWSKGNSKIVYEQKVELT